MRRPAAAALVLIPVAFASACQVAHDYATREFSADLEKAGGAASLEVDVGFPAGGIHLHTAAGNLLYHASITSCVEHTIASAGLAPQVGAGGPKLVIDLQGRPGVFAGFGGERNQMDLTLTSLLPEMLDLDLGEGESVIDLTGLRVRGLRLTAGAGDTRIIFGEPNTEPAGEIAVEGTIGDISIDRAGNANAGRIRLRGGVGTLELDLGGAWRRDAAVDVEASVGDLILRLPGRETGVRLELGSPWRERFRTPGFVRREGAFYSEGYDAAGRRLDVRVEAGIGDLIILEQGA